jgi:hypothetical protein
MVKAKEIYYFIIPIASIVALLLTTPYLLTSHGAATAPDFEVRLVDIAFVESQTQEIDISRDSIDYFAVSGRIEGTGEVRLLLRDSAGAEYTIYDSKAAASLAPITGFTSSNNDAGYLNNECSDTCVLDNINGPFQLVAEMDPGTTLKISQITYR